MNLSKVAVVTGSNKGIGYGIVKGLCEKFNGKVYLTARDEGRGKAAVDKLKELGYDPIFHELDITDQESICKLRDHIQETDGGIDLLVNNAAISYWTNPTAPINEVAENIIGVNYFGTLHVCEILFPILKTNAKVINISSSTGHISRITHEELRLQFAKPNMTIQELNEFMRKFISDAKDGKYSEKGSVSSYCVSKAGVSKLTFIQQKIFDNEIERRGIAVNCVHPGFTTTDMTNNQPGLTIDEAAQSSLFLALESHRLKGQYVWRDCTVVDWFAPSTPSYV